MTGKRVTIILVSVGVAVALFVGYIVIEVYLSGFWHGPDVKFGDQHLKTSVALVELHKTRFGQYPKTLQQLKYRGDWDAIALQSVRYVVNAEQSRYCIEVTRGWIGKPELTMPDEFWQGTGYEPSLCQ